MPATTVDPATRTPAYAVSLSGVSRSFPGAGRDAAPRRVLRDIDLEIAAGEIVALLGPSGCGKSTLLRQISGLDAPDTGDIAIDGTPLVGIDQRCAVAFQDQRLNVILGDVSSEKPDERVRMDTLEEKTVQVLQVERSF